MTRVFPPAISDELAPKESIDLSGSRPYVKQQLDEA
jgi:hypothetical protein